MNRKFPTICAIMLLLAAVVTHLALFSHPITRNIALAQEMQKTIYLTFDDGPSDKVTPKILDILKEENVQATFFVIGKQAESRKYLIEREFEEGHTVAVHSYSHVYKDIYSSPENLINDIDRCNEVIKSVTGKYATEYRFPGGSFGLDTKLINAVTAHGLHYVDWNASTCDAEIYNPTPRQLFQAAINTPANRDKIVMLAHDSTDKTVTAQALRYIIDYYREKGYAFARF